jgi:hypothetical protein
MGTLEAYMQPTKFARTVTINHITAINSRTTFPGRGRQWRGGRRNAYCVAESQCWPLGQRWIGVPGWHELEYQRNADIDRVSDVALHPRGMNAL